MKILIKIVSVSFAFILSISVLNDLSAQYISFEDSLRISEKAYLHTDRTTYFPNDDIWFKAYLIDASERLLTDHSTNLHIDLISPDSKIIDSKIIRLENGLGKGDFHLPDKLESGSYKMRAYTNYMRNFANQLYFNKLIIVVNPSDARKVFADGAASAIDKPKILFFPEGGSFVEGVPSKVAFKAFNSRGESCDIDGEIYSSSGDIVGTFHSVHNGMGSFSLIPSPGLTYFAVTRNLTGATVKNELPKGFPKGIVFNILRNDPNALTIDVSTNSETLPLVLNRNLSIKISAHNFIFRNADFRMNSLANRLSIPVEGMSEGIYRVTLSGPDSLPHCERLVYIGKNDDIRIKLETSKQVYSQRDSVSVRISLNANSSVAQEAFLSFASSKIISENQPRDYGSNICSWFLLESEVNGPVEEPAYYFDPSNTERLRDLDLLLLTQGWRDFKWKYDKDYYHPENGFIISGRVRKTLSDKPMINATVTLALFKTGAPLITDVKTDSTGRFYVEDIDFMGDMRIMATSTRKNNHFQGLVILDSVAYVPPQIEEPGQPFNLLITNNLHKRNQFKNYDSTLKENLNAFIQYEEIENSIKRKYRLSDTITPGEVTITAERINSLSGLIKARHSLMAAPVASLIVTPQLYRYGNAIKMIKSQMYYHAHLIERPIFVIDGMKVTSDMFNAVPINSIERVDILDQVASASIYGANTENPHSQLKPADGVISITIRNNGSYEPDRHVNHTANTMISGYAEPRIFYSPKHHSTLESDFKPDLRTTLFWEPDICVREDKDVVLNYFNADNPSKVRIIVEGITTAGIPIIGTGEYEVK